MPGRRCVVQDCGNVKNEVFRVKAEHFSFKMKVLASLKLAKQSQKTPFCSGE